jgi:hypothetical protein
MLQRTEPWAELLQLCADNCDPTTHRMQQVLLFGMAHSLFPPGVTITTTTSRHRTVQQLFALQFTTRSCLGPETLPPNLGQDLQEYNSRHPLDPLERSFFATIPIAATERRNSRRASGRLETPAIVPAVWPLDPAISVRDTRIVITILVEWYSTYQEAPAVAPWHSFFSSCSENGENSDSDVVITEEQSNIGRHTRSTRLMKVLDRVHGAALATGLTDTEALVLARKVLHLHIIGDIALTQDDRWYYTLSNGRDRQTFLLPP